MPTCFCSFLSIHCAFFCWKKIQPIRYFSTVSLGRITSIQSILFPFLSKALTIKRNERVHLDWQFDQPIIFGFVANGRIL